MGATKLVWEPYADGVECIKVPGGWLFRTSSWVELPTLDGCPRDGYWHWSDPVFVPCHDLYADTQERADNAEQRRLADLRADLELDA